LKGTAKRTKHITHVVSKQNEHIKHIQLVTGWSQTLLHMQSQLAFQKQQQKHKSQPQAQDNSIVTEAHKQKT